MFGRQDGLRRLRVGADDQRLGHSLQTPAGGNALDLPRRIAAIAARANQAGVGPAIDLVKRGDAANTWQASHFSWRIRSVVWAGVLYLLTAWLWLLFIVPGWIAWGLISLWFLFRIVKGMVRMNAGRSVEAA